MLEISIADMVLRTTAGEVGYQRAVVTGSGPMPVEVAADPAAAAYGEAERIAEQFRAAEYDARPGADRPFEVVGFRANLRAGRPERLEEATHGTLVSAGVTPWAVGYRDQKIGPASAGSGDVRHVNRTCPVPQLAGCLAVVC